MGNWAIGLSTGCFYRIDINRVLEKIRDSGFSLLEISTHTDHFNYLDPHAVEATAKHLDRLGLQILSLHAPFAPDIDISSPDRSRREHSQSVVFKVVEAGGALQAAYLVLHPGPELHYDRIPLEERLSRLQFTAESLSRIADHCHRHNLMLLLENMIPSLSIGNLSNLMWLWGALLEKDVGICLDTGHANLEGRLYSLVAKLAPFIKIVHANDNHGREDQHLAPGEGGLDWRRIVASLSRHCFQGTFILELAGVNEAEVSRTLERACCGRRFLRDREKELNRMGL